MVKRAEKRLIENSVSVHSTLGGGNYRFLGLILKSKKYHMVTGYNFESHVNPGALPTLPQNATQYQILNANSIYK